MILHVGFKTSVAALLGLGLVPVPKTAWFGFIEGVFGMTPEFGSLPLDESSVGFADATGKSKLPSSSSAAVLSSVVQKFHSVNCNGSTVVVVASPTCKNINLTLNEKSIL